VALAHRSARRFSNKGEGFVEEVVKRASVSSLLAQSRRFNENLGVLEQLHLGLEEIDRGNALFVGTKLLRLTYVQRPVY